MDDFHDPVPDAAHDPGGDPRAPSARSEEDESAPHVAGHRFQHPTVAPVSHPGPAPATATRDW
jgi:hypothetical protein